MGKLAEHSIELTEDSRKLISSPKLVIRPPIYERRFAIILPERLDIWFLHSGSRYPTYGEITKQAVQKMLSLTDVQVGVQFAIEYASRLEAGDRIIIGHTPCDIADGLYAAVFVLEKTAAGKVILDVWNLDDEREINWNEKPLSFLFQTYWELEPLYPEPELLLCDYWNTFAHFPTLMKNRAKKQGEEDITPDALNAERRNCGPIPTIEVWLARGNKSAIFISAVRKEVWLRPRRAARINHVAEILNECDEVTTWKRAFNEMSRLFGGRRRFEGDEFDPDKLEHSLLEEQMFEGQ